MHTTRTSLFVVALSLVLFAIGCQSTGSHSPAAGDVPRDSSAALVEYIGDQPYVTAEAGYRAAYMLAHGEMFPADYAQLAALMELEELVRPTWDYPADRPLRCGDVGFMICRACEIRSGLNWLLTGLGRYAWRELQYRRIAGPGSEYNRMTGGEFVGVLLRAESYLRDRGDEPAPELPRPE